MMRAYEAIAKNYRCSKRISHSDVVTISQMYTEDAGWIIPEAPIIQGREAIAQAWKGIIGSGGNTLRVNTLEVQESGDWTYEVGRFTASPPMVVF